MQINIIEFVSQATNNGWINQGYTNKPTTAKVIGFVTNETDDSLTLVQGYNNFKQDFNIINVSKSQITKRQELIQVSEDFDTVKYKELQIKDEESSN